MPGRFDRIWSLELERGVIAAVNDRGMSCPAAADLALSGRLPHPDEPERMVDIPKRQGVKPARMRRLLIGNARNWTHAERRRRQGKDVPPWVREKGNAASIDELATKLIGIAATEVDAIERAPRGKRDLDRARKAAQMLREAQALDMKQAPSRSGAMRAAAEGKTPETNGTAEAGAAGAIAAMNETRRGEMPRRDDEDDTGKTETDAGASDTDHGEDQAEGPDEAGILRSARAQHGEDRAAAAAELGMGYQ